MLHRLDATAIAERRNGDHSTFSLDRWRFEVPLQSSHSLTSDYFDCSRHQFDRDLLLFILAAGIFAIIAYIYPLFPRAVAMAIVAERGFRSEYERYRQTFAKQGVQLTPVRTEGFIENLADAVSV